MPPMRTVIFSMSMSLDGYINGPDGSFDWGAPDEELHQFHNDRVREQTHQLCGRNLYEIMRYWENPADDWGPVEHDFADVWKPMPKTVFSTTLTQADLGPDARLATGSVADEVGVLDGVVGVGGATLAHALALENLIDVYDIFICPVLVGGGIPYFAPDVGFTKLELAGQRSFAGGVTHLRYERR